MFLVVHSFSLLPPVASLREPPGVPSEPTPSNPAPLSSLMAGLFTIRIPTISPLYSFSWLFISWVSHLLLFPSFPSLLLCWLAPSWNRGHFPARESPHPCYVTESYLLWGNHSRSLCPVLWVVFGWGTGLGASLGRTRFPGTVIHLGMGPDTGRAVKCNLTRTC